MTQNAQHMNALRYVVNTAGNATWAQFDDDFDPIGPKLREALAPTFITVNDDGRLILTGTGARALAKYAAEANRPAPLPSRATPIDPAHAAGVKPSPFPVPLDLDRAALNAAIDAATDAHTAGGDEQEQLAAGIRAYLDAAPPLADKSR